MKTIDLGFKSDLDKSISKKFNYIARTHIDEFHKFISKISLDNKEILDWWMSSPSSRYTLSSPLYYNFCLIYLLKYILQNDIKVDRIFVDNNSIKNLFNQIIKSYNSKIIIISKDSYYKKLNDLFVDIYQ